MQITTDKETKDKLKNPEKMNDNPLGGLVKARIKAIIEGLETM